ncbi:hypothetical protein ACWCQS_45945 [Streptomyces sp. NPDC002076]
MAPKPHYLPAALIGGFGVPETGRVVGLRHAKVCVRRRKEPEKVFGPLKAENIAYQYGLYDVDDPSSDLPADFAEAIWQEYEGALPTAILALEQGTFTRDDWKTILLHVQAQSIRHPDYDRVAVTYIQGEGGLPTPGRDHVQRQRQTTFRETRQWMANARYALIRRGAAAPRFVLNDKGYIPMHDTLLDLKGVLFPVSGDIAVLMVVGAAQPTDDYEAGPLTERTLNAKGMELVNRAAWTVTEITCVMGHPDDADYLLQLPETGSTLRLPRLGPYRGNREPSYFHWVLTGTGVPRPREGQDFR